MKFITCFPTFLLLSNIIFSQNGQDHVGPTFDLTRPTTVLTPSANVASLMKVTDVPVSYYTGTAQVKVPLYTVSTNFTKVNISADYSSSGMKVEEESGLIGGGWNLQAGGSIARAAAATPDEGYGQKKGYRFSAAHYSLPLYMTDPEGNSWFNTLTDCNNKELSEGKFYDLAPDIYYLNFNGYSAKMFFDKNGTAMISPYKAWKVEGSDSDGYRITVEDGTKYIFDLIEVTTTDSWSNNDDVPSMIIPTRSAWFLTKIVSPNLVDTIKFGYSAVSYSEYNKNPDEAQANFKIGQTQYSCNAPSELSHYTAFYSGRDISTYLLTSIESRLERVEFTLHNGRRDINDTIGLPYQLDSIRVFNRLAVGAAPVKDFHFKYSYFGDSSSSDALTRRLMLTAIKEFSVTHTDSLAHQFTYYNPTAVPVRNSKAQDHWGYYNGSVNGTLIPAYDDHRGNVYSGADREPDTAQVRTGLLTSIRYPTGGTTSFEYESNDYSYSDKGYVNRNGELDSTLFTNSEVVSTAGLSTSSGERRDTIKVADVGFDDHNVTVSFKISGPNNSDPLADVAILDSAGNEIWARVVSYGVFVTEQIALTPGKTFILVARRYASSYLAILHVDFPDWQILPAPAVYSLPGGGCRIKRIVQYDGVDHSRDKVKRYSYLLNDTTSSGYLFDHPLYENYTYNPVICYITVNPAKVGDYTYFTRHSTSLMTLSRTQGSYIGYSKVTVLDDVSAQNGKDEYYYNTSPHDQGGNGYPYIPKNSRDDLRGLLQQHAVYDSNGRLLQKTVNAYNLHNTAGDPNFKWILGYKVGPLRRDVWYDLNGCPLDNSWSFRGSVFKQYQFWPVLTSTVDSVFTVSGGGTFATATYYDYDTTNLLVRRVKTLTSKGDTLYTNYTYPQDYAGQAIYDSMTNRHIWAKGIEKSVYLGVKLLSREKRNYDFFNFNIAGIKSTDLQKGNQATENRFSIHGYDQHENLLEQSKFNDVHTAYLYDYASQYPVATIANADSASVAYSSFEADGKGRWAVSSELRSDTAITGTKSYDLANGNLSMGGLSSGKIYRLSYWSRNGAKTISGGTGSGRTGRTANGWTYYEMDFTATSSSLTISGSGLIDEVRFCPQAAQMTTYTYIPLVGISSISDINGDITYYEYDGFNRLRIVKDVQGNILKSHQYNYANTISQ